MELLLIEKGGGLGVADFVEEVRCLVLDILSFKCLAGK